MTWDFLIGVFVGLVVGGCFGVILMAAFASGAREDRVRGEMLQFEDLGRQRIGV